MRLPRFCYLEVCIRKRVLACLRLVFWRLRHGEGDGFLNPCAERAVGLEAFRRDRDDRLDRAVAAPRAGDVPCRAVAGPDGVW